MKSNDDILLDSVRALMTERDKMAADAASAHTALGQCLMRHRRVRRAGRLLLEYLETRSSMPAELDELQKELRAALLAEPVTAPVEVHLAVEVIDQEVFVALVTQDAEAAKKRAAQLAMECSEAVHARSPDMLVSYLQQFDKTDSIREDNYEVWLLKSELKETE